MSRSTTTTSIWLQTSPTHTYQRSRTLAERYYASVTRYTTSSFMRLKLSGQLVERGLAPHIYESRQEALAWLNGHHRAPDSTETSERATVDGKPGP